MILATNFAVLVGLFLLFALSRAYLRFRDGSISLRQFLFWCVLWIGAGAAIFYPQNTDEIAARFGVSRGSDIIVYVSIIALFYLAFRIYAALSAIEHNLTRLVRALAIEETNRIKSENAHAKAK